MSHTLNPQDITLDLKSLLKLFSKKRPAQLADWTISSTAQTVEFHDGSEYTGIVIRPPDWKYPIVVDDKGFLHYDIYGYDISQSEAEQRQESQDYHRRSGYATVWGYPGDVAKLVSFTTAVELKYDPSKVIESVDDVTHEVEYIFA